MQRFAGLKDTGKLGKCNAGNGLTALFHKSFSVFFLFLSAVYLSVGISKSNEIKTLCFQFFINTSVMKRFRVTFSSVGWWLVNGLVSTFLEKELFMVSPPHAHGFLFHV